MQNQHDKLNEIFDFIQALELKIEKFRADQKFCFTTQMRQSSVIKIKRLEQALDHGKEKYKSQLKKMLESC
jgi:uncharacterized protein YerC